MALKDLVTIDGHNLGKVYGASPAEGGHLRLQYRKVSLKHAKYFTDRRRASKHLRDLFKLRKVDPKHNKVLVALAHFGDWDLFTVHGSEIYEGKDVVLVFRNHQGMPVPLEALASKSPTERDRISLLTALYQAYIQYERPVLLREVDLYREVVKYQSRLINYRDYQVESLLKSNIEARQVLTSAQSTIAELKAHISHLESVITTLSKETTSWQKAYESVADVIPQLSLLAQQLAEKISTALGLTMERHVEAMSQHEQLVQSLNAMLARIKELESEHAMIAAQLAAGQVPGEEKKKGKRGGRKRVAEEEAGTEEGGEEGGEE